MKQDDLARLVGVRALAISEAERGEATPRTDTVLAVSQVLDVDVGWLLTGEGRGPESTSAEDPAPPPVAA